MEWVQATTALYRSETFIVLFLIDGYNLLYALGMAPHAGGPSLERSRLRLIEWLAVELGPDAGNVCVVFDSRQAAGAEEQIHRGIYVLFSRGETADDLIERLLLDEQTTAGLVVVSNDQRIRHAAQRRGCPDWTCGTFIDWLMDGRKTKAAEPGAIEGDKPQPPSADEVREWLNRFGANDDAE